MITKNIELPDFVDNTQGMEVDLLIGLDFYFSFVTGRIRKGTHGPVAVETNLGWVLCGAYTEKDESTELAVQFNTTHVVNLS